MNARDAAMAPTPTRRAPRTRMPGLVVEPGELSFLGLNARRVNGYKSRDRGSREKGRQKRAARNPIFVSCDFRCHAYLPPQNFLMSKVVPGVCLSQATDYRATG